MSVEVTVRDFVEAKESTLGGLCLAHKRQFTIPMNQRPWSWKKPQISELWRDLLATAGHFYDTNSVPSPWQQRPHPIGEPHFMGAFVFVEKDSGELEVFDGQQRLTAISMIVSTLRQIAHDLSKTTSIVELQTNSLSLAERLARWIQADPDPGEHRPRIIVDSEFCDIFDALIIKPYDQAQRDALLSALSIDFKELVYHRKLKEGVEIVGELIGEYFCDLSEKARYDALVGLANTIESCLLCIWSFVREDSFAFEVFKCLNAKGLPLSDADKIKNELYLHSNSSDHQQIRICWNEVYKNVPLGNIAGYLRFRHAAFHGECKQATVYVTIRDEEILKSSVAQLVDEWKQDSILMAAICLKGGISLKSKTKDLLAEFETLRISLAQIFLIAAAKKFLPSNEDEFLKAAKLCRNFCFRVLTICGKDTSFLEEKLGLAARRLTNGASLTDIAKDFRASNTDSEFEQAFAEATESRTKVQYYILYELESYLGGASGLVPAPHSPTQNIEHILPRTPSNKSARLSEWNWVRPYPEKHKLYINRLGNLCLLEGNINQQISNYDFSAKQQGTYPGSAIKYKGKPRKCYTDSKLHLVAELADKSKYPTWDFSVIEQRQSEMAKLAVNTWSLGVS